MTDYEKIKQEILKELDKHEGSVPFLDLIESIPYPEAKVQKACRKLDEEENKCELEGGIFRKK